MTTGHEYGEGRLCTVEGKTMKQEDITKEHIEFIEVHCPLNPDTVIKLPMDQVQCRTRTSSEKFVSAQLGFNCSACRRFHLSDLIPTGFLVISNTKSTEDRNVNVVKRI